MDKLLNRVIRGDCRKVLEEIPDQSVHLCVTDPPYFIDQLDEDWDSTEVKKSQDLAKVVGGLPVGMKFDPKQGIGFQLFMKEVSDHIFRILKPGGFYVCFSQARLYHRLGIAVEEAGFEIRDMLGWKYEGQAKAFTQDHFVKRMPLNVEEKQAIIDSMGGRKTPQLKPQIEPMVLGQKPKEGTFVQNWLLHEVGLVDVSQSLDDRFPGNIMEVPKPAAVERGSNPHPTLKPVSLIEHLIRLFSKEGQIVLDPFLGSGTTAVAAMRADRQWIGIERDTLYADHARGRVLEAAFWLDKLS